MGGLGMMRDKVVGNWCRRCEFLMVRCRKDCRCMVQMDERQAERHRVENWKSARVTLEVTMEGANR